MSSLVISLVVGCGAVACATPRQPRELRRSRLSLPSPPLPSCCLCVCSNIKPLLAIDYPNCFGHQQPHSCSQSAADSVTYVEARVCGAWGGTCWPSVVWPGLHLPQL